MGRHDRFLTAAAAEAEQSTLGTKHGSLLVRSGKILGSGHNSDRSRLTDVPGNDSNVTSLHSEVAAVEAFRGFYNVYDDRVRKKLRHCDLYVVRLLPEGRQVQGTPERESFRFGFSKPCVRCLRALQTYGVHRVIFTTGEEDPDGGIGCEIKAVQELLKSARLDGHQSRGDEGAVACGAVRNLNMSVCGAAA
eukprot:CAMPEP_0174718188 /NCGR_PEP_ID=MMETSP1094-20130205/28244_1 /TAXON_ID=156173 /ORGANISM="Chrysochromulina brevifilum, Strain UTEX LB 985" /LENGTH=191 /DNA_ID=CAMNT_0015918239 /DNA_START=71 /DNA_END=647 /DNA_ORIENTATION=+